MNRASIARRFLFAAALAGCLGAPGAKGQAVTPASGASSPAAPPPLTPPPGPPPPVILPPPSDQSAQAKFTRKCAVCHAPGGMGMLELARRFGPKESMLSARQDLDAATVRETIAKGVRSMPPMTPGDVSEADAREIAAYLSRSTGEKK